ncbi:MAG: Hsp33 family molecular chaperone HslO [Alphaproteobacteria bacterium]
MTAADIFYGDALGGDDLIQPFQIHGGGTDGPLLHGRMARLGPLIDELLDRHDYPDPVARLLGEALALTATLAAALKFDGIFSFQIQGDGPVSLLVVDARTDEGESTSMDLRGYARFDAERLDGADGKPVRSLIGEGYLAFTVDQGEDMDRYQGMVALEGETLAECAQHYFRQSQQLDAAVMLACDRVAGEASGTTCWRAAGLMLQRIADGDVIVPPSYDGDDPWRRAMMLMATGTVDEMLDPALSAVRYLHRLFHQERLRISPARSFQRGCRCSSERVINVLRSMPRDEISELAEDGVLEVKCEFCAATYRFVPDDLDGAT